MRSADAATQVGVYPRRSAATSTACSASTASHAFIRSALVRSRQCRNRPAASPRGSRASTWWISNVNDDLPRLELLRRLKDPAQPGHAIKRVQGAEPVVDERDRQPALEAEVVGEPPDQGVPVVEMEVRRGAHLRPAR